MAKNDSIYASIVRKLGFDPKDYKQEHLGTECDDRISPFSKLNIDEIQYLLDNKIYNTEYYANQK